MIPGHNGLELRIAVFSVFLVLSWKPQICYVASPPSKSYNPFNSVSLQIAFSNLARQPTNAIAMENEYRTRHIHTGYSGSFLPSTTTRRYRDLGALCKICYIVGCAAVSLCSLQSTHCSLAHVVLSSSSFASLTFVAKYGLPPRSGWFNSISVRCALRTLSLERDRSLRTCALESFRIVTVVARFDRKRTSSIL